MLTLDVACFVGGSYYFCVQILLKIKKKKTKNKKKKSEVEEDIEQNVIEGGNYEENLLKLLMTYADCTKIMLVKPVWFFTCK